MRFPQFSVVVCWRKAEETPARHFPESAPSTCASTTCGQDAASITTRRELTFHHLSLALQLPFLQVSESMGNHDSKIVDAASVD